MADELAPGRQGRAAARSVLASGAWLLAVQEECLPCGKIMASRERVPTWGPVVGPAFCPAAAPCPGVGRLDGSPGTRSWLLGRIPERRSPE